MASLSPLDYKVPIVNPDGTPTREFMRKWSQQQQINGTVPGDAAALSTILDGYTMTPGGILVRGASAWGGLNPPGSGNEFLRGGSTPQWSQVDEADLNLTDLLTANVSTARHGLAPKLPNDATKYLDGTGGYSVPAGGGGGGFHGAKTYFNTDKTGINISSVYDIVFDAAEFDTDSMFSTGSGDRLTIPAGYTYAQMSASCVVGSITANMEIFIRQFSSAGTEIYQSRQYVSNLGNFSIGTSSNLFSISSGDYFKMSIFSTDTSVTLYANYASLIKTTLAAQLY